MNPYSVHKVFLDGYEERSPFYTPSVSFVLASVSWPSILRPHAIFREPSGGSPHTQYFYHDYIGSVSQTISGRVFPKAVTVVDT